ncbi:MAG TPA: MFS transporter [Thermoanaerobaculia bacterium]|nr:MFS transporter [Thermoanaerobaculia bacterium]
MQNDVERTGRSRLASVLALEPNVVAVAVAMFLLAAGENLWKKFLPKLLEALGAPVVAIGLYGSIHDLLDGLYQYPGGWISDRYGRKKALQLFVLLAALGYLIYAVTPRWELVFAGLLFVMAWQSMASPTLFAVIGDALPRERRAMGFTVQSILKRIPIAIAPIIGGLLIARHGSVSGIRIALVVAIVLAIVTLLVVSRIRITLPEAEPLRIGGVWRTFPRPLRSLLLSDVFIRTCEGLVDVFLVLYAINIVGVSPTRFGVLIAIQTITAILVYLPAARIADRIGRKPFVIATFLAFSLFPLAVVLSSSFADLAFAFVIGGLREIGEPARKALIIDLSDERLRARSVGLYYLIRSVAIAPSAVAGGLLWRFSPDLPFYVALVIGLAGTVLFAATVREEYA